MSVVYLRRVTDFSRAVQPLVQCQGYKNQINHTSIISLPLPMAETIQQLSDLISSSVADLIKLCSTNNLRVPEMNEPSSPKSEAFRDNRAIAQAANIIAAAAIQLAASILSPQESIVHAISGVRIPLNLHCTRLFLSTCVASSTRSRQPCGLPSNVTSQKFSVRRAQRLFRIPHFRGFSLIIPPGLTCRRNCCQIWCGWRKTR